MSISNTSDSSKDVTVKELHVAPMLDVTTTEFRYFCRLLSKHVILWTEMIVDETLMYTSNNPEQYLYSHPSESPVVCQLGGNHPEWTAQAIQLIETLPFSVAAFTEINLNAECPSHRVVTEHRNFGAALMKDIDQAVAMVQSMKKHAQKVLISVKTRIGVDEDEGDDEFLHPFIQRLHQEGGCRRFYIHARKVYTQGLNPTQNRTIPPLNYSAVYRLCKQFPDIDFWINGGIRNLQEAKNLVYGVTDCYQKKSHFLEDT